MPQKHDPSEMFRVLGATARLHIIELLRRRGSMGVTDLADELGVTPAAVSQHLKLMRQSGLVTKERDGYRVPYSLDADGLSSCCNMLVDACSCGCHGAGIDGARPRSPGACGGKVTLEALQERKSALEEALRNVKSDIAALRKATANEKDKPETK